MERRTMAGLSLFPELTLPETDIIAGIIVPNGAIEPALLET
jgi:hypothetical protein